MTIGGPERTVGGRVGRLRTEHDGRRVSRSCRYTGTGEPE